MASAVAAESIAASQSETLVKMEVKPKLTKTSKNQEKPTLTLPSIATVDSDMIKMIKDKIKDSIDEPELDSGLPHTVKSMSQHTICLPREFRLYSEELRAKIEESLIDKDMKEDLETTYAINWCRSAKKVYPIKIAGDGNCLLHAVSKAMWGIHDNTLLRRLVYIALVEDDQEFIRNRWQKERKQLDAKVPDGGVEFDEDEWDSEWAIVVKAAEDVKKKASTQGAELPFECLEEIHIFVLANVLKRPIVVLADTVIRNIEGSALGLNNFPGIYLPLLWDSSDCIKSPLVLGYSMNHFTPLIGLEDPESNDAIRQSNHSVPLVNHMLESQYIHFLTEEEESKAHDLLQSYMNITETTFTKSDDTSMVLCATIEYISLPDELNVAKKFFTLCDTAYTEFVAKQAKRVEKVNCQTHGCKKFGKAELDFFCSKCYLLRESESDNGNGAEDQNQTEALLATVPTAPSPSAPSESIMSFEAAAGEEVSVAAGGAAAGASGPQTPSSPTISMIQKMCSFPDCENHCACTTKPYCHEHIFLSTIRERKPDECLYPGCHETMTQSCRPYCQTHKLPTNEDDDSNNGVEPSITESHCVDDGCNNFTSRFTHPYCHEHKPESSVVTTFCARIGCANYQKESTKPFCEEHANAANNPFSTGRGARAGSADSGAGGDAEGTSASRFDDMLPVFMAFICAIPSCDKKVSIDTDMYCKEHYIEKYGALPRHSSPTSRADDITIPSRRVFRSSSSSERVSPARDTTAVSQARSTEAQAQSLDSSATTAARSTRCHEPGCKLSGIPSWNYYCSQHRVMNESHARPRVTLDDSPSPTPRVPSPEPVETRTLQSEVRSRLSHHEDTSTTRQQRINRHSSSSPTRFSFRRRERSPSTESSSPSPPRRRISGGGYRHDTSYMSARSEFSFPELNTSFRETRTSSLYSSRYSNREFGSTSRVDSGISRYSRGSYSTRLQSPSPIRNGVTNRTSSPEPTPAITSSITKAPAEEEKQEEKRKPPQMIKMTPPEEPKSRLDKTRELLRIGLCMKNGCNNSAVAKFGGFCQGCAEQSRFIQIEKQVETIVVEENAPCITPGCRLIGTVDFGGVCYKCSDKALAENKSQGQAINGHSGPETLEIINNFPTASTTETRALKECKSDNCFAVANGNSDGFCTECFTRRYRIGTLATAEATNDAFGGARPKEKRKFKSQSLERDQQRDIITLREDSEIFAGQNASPEINGAGQDPSMTSYEKNMKAIKRCPGRDCKRVAYDAFNGMCQLCYNKTFQTAGRTGAKSSQSSAKRTTEAPVAAAANECKTEGCDMFGTDAQLGFCSTCYRKHKAEQGAMKAKHKSKLNGPREHEHAYVPTAKPCTRAGCDMYGDPNLEGFCSQCYKHKKRSRLSPNKNNHRTNKVKSKGHHPVTSVPRVCDTKLKNERAGNPPSNHDLYEESVKKIEAASRSAFSRCKNTGCPHMGNSRCRGYCNTCFPYVK